MVAMSDDYTAKDIMVLTGPQGIRKRPGMYIGSTGSPGFIHLLYEVLDNAVDEAVAGHAKKITIKLSNDEGIDTAEISDDGRGIPIDIMPKLDKPALEVLMTSIHSGAKFDNKIYKVAGGLHGVGLTVVNSLSEYTIVTVKKNGKIYRESFGRGAPTSKLEVLGECPPNETGTTVLFKPDKEIFSVSSFDTVVLVERLRYLCFLNPGIHIDLKDMRGDQPKESTFFSQNGITDFMDYVRSDREALTKPILISGKTETTAINIALQYVASYSEEIVSFVNNIKTPEGGTHVTGFRTAVTRSILNYINKRQKQKSKLEIEGDDTKEGLIAIISILMQNPEFEGQTKEKLGNPTIRTTVDNLVYKELSTFLEENPAEGGRIVSKITDAAMAREAARKAKELARTKSSFEGSILPGKEQRKDRDIHSGGTERRGIQQAGKGQEVSGDTSAKGEGA